MKAVTTLVYTAWRGLQQPPYHYNGLRPTLVRTSDPEVLIDGQDSFTKEIIKDVAQHLRVDAWSKGWPDGTAFTPMCYVEMLRDAIKRIQGNLQSHVRRIGKSKRYMKQAASHCRGGKPFLEPEVGDVSISHREKVESEFDLPTQPVPMQGDVEEWDVWNANVDAEDEENEENAKLIPPMESPFTSPPAKTGAVLRKVQEKDVGVTIWDTVKTVKKKENASRFVFQAGAAVAHD